MPRLVKAAVAATAAVLTLTAAAAAAVILPSGGEGSHAASIQTSAAVDVPPVADPIAPLSLGSDDQPSPPAPPAAPPAAPPVSAGARAAAAAEAPSTPLPSVPTPTLPASIPVPPGLADIPTKVMNCLAPVFDLVSNLPSMPAPQQLTAIGPAIVSCVTAIVADLPLPSGLNGCISEIMGFVKRMTAQLPSGFSGLGRLDVAACIPSGLPVPTGVGGFGGFPGGGGRFGR